MKNKRLLVVMLLVTIFICAGCSNKEVAESEEIVTLTERQIKILEDKELPINFNELTSEQKEAIMKIEDVLQYLENKYDKEFGYIQYNQNDFFGNNYMLVHALTDDEILGSFTVDISEEEYTDTYMCKAIRHKFEYYIKSELNAMTANVPLEVFIDITDTNLEYVPENEREFDGNVECGMWIFIDGTYFDSGLADELKVEFSEWMARSKIYGSVQIILLKPNSLDYITSYNFTDYLSEDNYTYRDSFFINKNE